MNSYSQDNANMTLGNESFPRQESIRRATGKEQAISTHSAGIYDVPR